MAYYDSDDDFSFSGNNYGSDFCLYDDDYSDGYIFSDEECDTSYYNERHPTQEGRGEVLVLQGDGKDLLSALWTGLQEGTNGARDIQVKFMDDKEMCISSTILSKMSHYFQTMLDCGLKEALEGKVTLPTVTHSTFTRMMAFTLGQKVEMGSREELVELLQVAEMMQMERLMEACIDLLEKQWTKDSCLDTFLLIRRFRPNKVQRAVSSVISFMQHVGKTTEWCSLEEEDINAILKAWATEHSHYMINEHFPAVFDAVLRWIEANEADPDVFTQMLSLLPFEKLKDDHIQDYLISHSWWVKCPTIMKVVQERLKPKGEFTLLVVGSAVSKGDACTDTYISCWSESRQEWSIFPPSPEEMPQDFAVVKADDTLIISGGMREKTGPSKKIWVADHSGWKERGSLITARTKHGMALVNHDVYVVGGLPGPLRSIEKNKRYIYHGNSLEVGTLPEAVYDCGVAAVNEKLIVVGGCSSEGSKNIIQTFHTRTHVAEVITLNEPPSPELDMGFTRYIGTMDALLFLSRSGHLLEVKVDDDTVRLQSQVLLKGFHRKSLFAAFLDDGGVVVCNNTSADCWHSLDGEKKKQETNLLRRLRNDIQVHGVFRFFLPSQPSERIDHTLLDLFFRQQIALLDVA